MVDSVVGTRHITMAQHPEMTIRHLLTHTSGISYGWENSYVDSLYRATGAGGWDGTIGEKVKIIAALPLNFQPGTQWKYGLSIDVVGYLVEVLSGQPLDAFLQSRIFDPLKMDDTGFYVPEEKHGRLSDVFRMDKEGKLKGAEGDFRNAFKRPVTLFSGGGGLVSTMDDYKRFCLMLLNGGALQGVRVLSEKTVGTIMSDQLPEATPYGDGQGHGLAANVDLETREYSWAGAASTKFWIDPVNEMIIITYAQLMPSDYSYADDFRKIVRNGLIQP
jgi:CubicO group peptidase (beta-lactamase class C family)